MCTPKHTKESDRYVELLEGHHGHGRDGDARHVSVRSCAYHLNCGNVEATTARYRDARYRWRYRCALPVLVEGFRYAQCVAADRTGCDCLNKCCGMHVGLRRICAQGFDAGRGVAASSALDRRLPAGDYVIPSSAHHHQRRTD